ncbi:MAG: hypothetical protein PVI95_00795 [Dehalococcoidia bacterium]|jgi:hypothetical protein
MEQLWLVLREYYDWFVARLIDSVYLHLPMMVTMLCEDVRGDKHYPKLLVVDA